MQQNRADKVAIMKARMNCKTIPKDEQRTIFVDTEKNGLRGLFLIGKNWSVSRILDLVSSELKVDADQLTLIKSHDGLPFVGTKEYECDGTQLSNNLLEALYLIAKVRIKDCV